MFVFILLLGLVSSLSLLDIDNKNGISKELAEVFFLNPIGASGLDHLSIWHVYDSSYSYTPSSPIIDGKLQGRSQPHSLGWARVPLSKFFLQILINVSSNFTIFFLILALRVGESATRESPGYDTGKLISSPISYFIIDWCTSRHCRSSSRLRRRSLSRRGNTKRYWCIKGNRSRR